MLFLFPVSSQSVADAWEGKEGDSHMPRQGVTAGRVL